MNDIRINADERKNPTATSTDRFTCSMLAVESRKDQWLNSR